MPVVASAARIPLDAALPIAESIVEHLALFCLRLELAGSIRRRLPDIGDVELVAIPAYRQIQPALFESAGAPSARPVDELDEHLHTLLVRADVRKRRDKNGRTFWGVSDKRLLWRYGAALTDWIAVDLFGATSATWGAKMALRTGPWELSKRLVTHKAKGGLLPNDLEFREGGLYRYLGGSARRVFVRTPDEETLFRELGLPYAAPEHRFSTSYQMPRGSARR